MRPRWRSRASALLAAVALAGTACPEEREPAGPITRREGGVVRIAFPEEPASLSPVEASPPAADLLRAVLPSFHTVTPGGRYRPALLAEEPSEVLKGQRQEVRFTLRPARWSDGRPITVADVAFTAETMREVGAWGFERLEEVVEDGPRRGRLVLEPPYPGWRELFSAGRFVLPSHTEVPVKNWRTGPPVSGGPFRIAERVDGRSVTLEANPRHWQRPMLDRVIVEFVPDPTTALQLLEAGELDAVAPTLGVAWGRRLERVEGIEVRRRFGPHLVHIAFNVARIRSVEDRRRLAAAFDRERFSEVVLREEGRVAQSVLSPEQPGSVPVWSRTAASPDSLPKRELTLAYPRGEVLDVLARAFQEAVRRAGGDIELVALDPDVFRRTYLPRRKFDMTLWETRSGPHSRLSRWFSSGGAEGPTGLRDEDVDRLLEVADLGGPQGSDAMARAQAVLADLMVLLPVFQPADATGARGFQGLDPNPTPDGPLWNVAAWSRR